MEWSLIRDAKTARGRTQAFLKRFHKEEDGVFLLFSLYTFLIMIVFAGMAVDLMRIETRRTELQATADRAVLAAADMQQELDGNAVILDYFDKAGFASTLDSYNTVETVSSRTATVEASDEVSMIFGGLLGAFNGSDDESSNGFGSSMLVRVRASAEERVENVEISLALDVSGSMSSYGRIGNMKTAAKEFVDTVLANNASDGRVTVTLVPYSEQVNVGPDIFHSLNSTQLHSYSYCLDVPNDQFTSVAINPSLNLMQDQHFQWNYNGGGNYIDATVCPQYTYEQIKPWSQSAPELKAQIDQLQPRAGTAIYMGMKWAAALLDPSTQSINNTLIADGKVSPAAVGRPVAYDTDNVLKAIVMMTDGENSSSQRISSFAYQNSSHYSHWSRYNFNWYLSRYVYSGQRSQWYWSRMTSSLADSLQASVCQAAKDAGIIVWTIGFEVSDTAATKMRNCASSPSHFFRVEGVEISNAFQAIAADINELRLIE